MIKTYFTCFSIYGLILLSQIVNAFCQAISRLIWKQIALSDAALIVLQHQFNQGTESLCGNLDNFRPVGFKHNCHLNTILVEMNTESKTT